MAPSHNLLFLFFFALSLVISFSCAASKPKPTAIHFAIRKNQTSLVYYVTTEFGIPGSSSNVDALLDLGGQYVWIDYSSNNSSSYKPVACGSNQCKKAKGMQCYDCISPPIRPGCTNNTSGTYVYNPLYEENARLGLDEDIMRIHSTDGNATYDIPKIQVFCADDSITDGFPGDHTKGLVGLGRTQVSLPAQVSSSFNLIPKFALCLPSTTQNGLGDLFIGTPPSIEDQSLSLVTTPLLVSPVDNYRVANPEDPSPEYFIGLKDIEVYIYNNTIYT